ncbi:MAG: hypothetical protein DWQ07_04395 [Chloroflexi bacterium]|nr:MAG: hypothetical protein DWQ07_04395 [Chloroflexota bacterium]MBL1194673.1 hypothetical protein [Chloroflexota bacterium]NOH11964.1 ABC transporter permease subunit [Chloroflexota bacterium]
MNAINALRALGPIDVRNIRRDSLLGWMIFVPLVSATVLRLAVPPITTSLLAQFGFDLAPYYPAILAYFFIMMGPIVFGVLVGFLLLDERDDDTLTALQVTPLSVNNYVVYRVIIPVILTIVLMFVIFPLANLGSLSFWPLLLATLVAAPMAPLFGLFLATFANNKVQGFAMMKGSGGVLFAPILAYFINNNWELAFGILPTYWPMKVYWLLEAGQGPVWPYVLVALVYQFALLAFLVRRFNKILYQ